VVKINLDGAYLLPCRCSHHDETELRAHREYRLHRRQGGNPNASHYSASKAGVIALTKSLGKELAGTDIAVNAVTPAAAKTAIFDQMTQQHIDFMLSKIRVDVSEGGGACVARDLDGLGRMPLHHRRIRYFRRPRDVLSYLTVIAGLAKPSTRTIRE
jgi:NAD(P)-dependent dehydrogenase (short-subunit alcohol dehydrogenase family)